MGEPWLVNHGVNDLLWIKVVLRRGRFFLLYHAVKAQVVRCAHPEEPNDNIFPRVVNWRGRDNEVSCILI